MKIYKKCATNVIPTILCLVLAVYFVMNGNAYGEEGLQLSDLKEVWISTYDSGFADRGQGIAVDSDNNVIVTGYSIINDIDREIFVRKYNSNGTLIWSELYGAGPYCAAMRVRVDSMNNIYIAGQEKLGANKDALLLKYTSDGQFVFIKRLDYGGRANKTTGLAVDNNDDVILGGTFNDSGVQYDEDYYIIKMDNDGNVLWKQHYATSGHDMAYDLIVDSNNNIIQAGQSPYYGLHVVKYSPDGDVLWNKGYYTGHFGGGRRVAVDAFDNIYITGDYQRNNHEVIDIRIIKYTPNGTRLWMRDYDSGEREGPSGIAINPEGYVHVYGNLQDGSGDHDTLLVVYDASGNHVGAIRYRTSYFEVADYITFDNYGNLVTVGRVDTDNNVDAEIIKFSYSSPPVLDPIGSQVVDEGQLLEFKVTAYDPDGDILTYSASNLPLGATFDPATQMFRWEPTFEQSGVYAGAYFEVSDGLESDSEIIIITVNDINRPPVASAGPDISIQADAGCSGTTTLSGIGSSDPDGDDLTYTWEGPFGLTTGPTPEVVLPLGEHIVTLTVDDGNGGVDADEVVVVVEDVTAPTIDVLTVEKTSLWPVNHEMVDIGFELQISDYCDPAPDYSIYISSDEPTATAPGSGGENHSPDAEITADNRILLRAERSGNGDGRVYQITVVATDSGGNSTTESIFVSVNKSKKTEAVDSGQHYDAAQVN